MYYSTDLVCYSLHTSPSAHNEGVIGSNDSDDVDPLLLELVILGEVGWEVIDVTSRLIGLGKFNDSNTQDLEKRTVKAPGTEKRTTFLPFQLSVERVVACDHLY